MSTPTASPLAPLQAQTSVSSSRRIYIRYACYALSVLLVATYGWLRSVFGNRLTVEQIFFHFDLGLNSLTGVDLYLILDALQWIVLPTTAVTFALYIVGRLTERIATAMALSELFTQRGLLLRFFRHFCGLRVRYRAGLAREMRDGKQRVVSTFVGCERAMDG